MPVESNFLTPFIALLVAAAGIYVTWRKNDDAVAAQTVTMLKEQIESQRDRIDDLEKQVDKLLTKQDECERERRSLERRNLELMRQLLDSR